MVARFANATAGGKFRLVALLTPLFNVFLLTNAGSDVQYSHRLNEAFQRAQDPVQLRALGIPDASLETTAADLKLLRHAFLTEINSRLELTHVSDKDLETRLGESIGAGDASAIRDSYVIYCEVARRGPAFAKNLLQELDVELYELIPLPDDLTFIQMDSIVDGYIAVSRVLLKQDSQPDIDGIIEILNYLDEIPKFIEWNYPRSYEIVFAELERTWVTKALDILRSYQQNPGLYFSARVSELRLRLSHLDLIQLHQEVINSALEASRTKRPNLAPEYTFLNTVPLLRKEFLSAQRPRPEVDQPEPFRKFLTHHIDMSSAGWYATHHDIDEWRMIALDATSGRSQNFLAIAGDPNAPITIRRYALELQLVSDAVRSAEAHDAQVLALIARFRQGFPESVLDCCSEMLSAQSTDEIKRSALYYLASVDPSTLVKVGGLANLPPEVEFLLEDVSSELKFKNGLFDSKSAAR